jgi:ADP-ribose pyrophosphatase YjhB (NUDIX family)
MKTMRKLPRKSADKTDKSAIPQAAANYSVEDGSFVNVHFVYVDGVFVKDGKILLLKRNVEPFKNLWHVVGGQVEENESLQAALKREYKEETNLDVEVGEILGTRLEKTADRTKLIFVLRVVAARGTTKINHENIEVRWFTKYPADSVYDYSRFLTEPK